MSPSSEKTNGGAATLGQFETLRAVEQFLYRQADILDDRKWDDWLGLFTEDGHYWMPVSDDQTVADGVPNIFYEDLDLMRVRAKRVTHPHAWSQQPGHRTSHVVSNVVIDEEQPETGDVVVRSKFHVVEYWNDNLTWVEINRVVSDGVDQDTFEVHEHTLPLDAHHNEFRLRFRLDQMIDLVVRDDLRQRR